MANILLIAPKTRPGILSEPKNGSIEFSLTLGTLSRVLKRGGNKVFSRLNYLPWRLKWLPSHENLSSIDAVGIITNSVQGISAIELARNIKNYDFNIPIIGYGAYAILAPEYLLKNGFDYCIQREGDKTFNDLVNNILTKGKSGINFIEGISYLDISGAVYRTRARKLLKSLDDFPFTDWKQDDFPQILRLGYENIPKDPDMVNFSNLSPPIIFRFPIESSRGCQLSCINCSTREVQGSNWNKKSIIRIFQDYKLFHEFIVKYLFPRGLPGKLLIDFKDYNFCFKKSHVKSFSKGLLDKYRIEYPYWIASGRASELKDPKLISKMGKAGCIGLKVMADCGYETGQKLTGKKMKLNEIDEVSENLLSIEGLKQITFDWNIGWPWETRQQCFQTLLKAFEIIQKDMRKIKCPIYTLMPLTGTDARGKLIATGEGGEWEINHPILSKNDFFELRVTLTTIEWLFYLINTPNRRYIKSALHNIINFFITIKNANFQKTGRFYHHFLTEKKITSEKEFHQILMRKVLPIVRDLLINESQEEMDLKYLVK
ncbi:MAG: B12-binding domain-containing radical SAM protein [Candidatus Hodarchaeales archaeon]|jgi:radical SAM superfamily enzyme YgiQ (UPF0313 family)